jgi:hypothetical protein
MEVLCAPASRHRARRYPPEYPAALIRTRRVAPGFTRPTRWQSPARCSPADALGVAMGRALVRSSSTLVVRDGASVAAAR